MKGSVGGKRKGKGKGGCKPEGFVGRWRDVKRWQMDRIDGFKVFENLEKSRVATEYIHATPTLRPAYFHFAVYVEVFVVVDNHLIVASVLNIGLSCCLDQIDLKKQKWS